MRNVRDLPHPAAVLARDRLAALNAAHPWSHNGHFHGWVLRNLPARRRAALDVGCGQGELLARLATHFTRVHGTDSDPHMRADSTGRCADLPQVTVGGEGLEDLRGPYDLITMVAVLHHLDEEPALRRVTELLAPGGRLAVVGLAVPASATDTAFDLASAVANPVMGLVKHPRRTTAPPGPDPFPVRDPELNVDQLRAISRRALPGAHLRRRLFFRYTLCWTKPRE